MRQATLLAQPMVFPDATVMPSAACSVSMTGVPADNVDERNGINTGLPGDGVAPLAPVMFTVSAFDATEAVMPRLTGVESSAIAEVASALAPTLSPTLDSAAPVPR